jgi:signal transduction histidine kinase
VDVLSDALEGSGERIAAMVRSEREFSANASHQLRTPLTAVRVRLESIVDAEDLAEVREDAVAALDQADRLEDTIKDLLALARTGHVSPPGTLDIHAFVRARAMVWRPAFAGVGRRLAIDVERDAVAVASNGGVRQILDVLLENAREHGGGTVRISGRRRGDYVEVRVADDGSGVPEGMERSVFERHVTGGDGSGVGLHLARTLAQADGGRLDLERPRPPVFTLRLPAAR